MTETINISMTWENTLTPLLALIENGNSKGRAFAMEELRKMAWLADNATTPLELMLFPTTAEGSIADHHDEIACYDVVLKFQGGDPIKEYEGLTEAEADIKFEQLMEEYPQAFPEDLRELLR